MTSSLKVRGDIRTHTLYICRRCGVQSGSPDGRCDAAQSDLTDPAARLNLHDFEPVEFVSGWDFLHVEDKKRELEAALAWYADPANYKYGVVEEIRVGERARAALIGTPSQRKVNEDEHD